MAELLPLPPEAQARFDEYGAASYEAEKQGDMARAEALLLEAWQAIPEPALHYDPGPGLAVDITAFYRDRGNTAQARLWLARAREGYGPGPNPHTEFLAGTVHYQAGERDEAYAIFDALYRHYKKRPFQGYPAEYLDFYLAQARSRDAGATVR